jgi:hypothetical protein
MIAGRAAQPILAITGLMTAINGKQTDLGKPELNDLVVRFKLKA